jgi:hypothetical protein
MTTSTPAFRHGIGPLFTAATNSVPSAEEATEVQFVLGALVVIQVIPEPGEV